MSFKPNLAQIQSLIKRDNLDALICMSPENFTYLAGVYILTVSSIRPRQGFAVIPAKGEPFLVICSIEKSLAQAEGWISDVRVYTEFLHNPIDALVASLKDKGLALGKFGIDLDYLPASSHQRLTKSLPGVEFVNTTEQVSEIRAIKTPDEVSFMEKAT